jgi:hypothetical protein
MPPPGIFLSDQGKVMGNVPSKHFFLIIAESQATVSTQSFTAFRLFRFISFRFTYLG